MPSLRRVVMCLCAALSVAAAACSKDGGNAPPAGVPPLPGGSPGAGQVTSPSGGAADKIPTPVAGDKTALPPGHPSTASGELPAGHPPMGATGGQGATPPSPHGAAPANVDPKMAVRGTIDVAPSLKAKVGAGDAIFVVVRQDDGTEKGPLLAAKKYGAGAWPIAFSVDGNDQMGGTLAGKVVVLAYDDKDGDAISHNAGDLLGAAKAEVPSENVKLVIDRTL